MYWFTMMFVLIYNTGYNPKSYISNKLLIYKTIIKPIWTYSGAYIKYQENEKP